MDPISNLLCNIRNGIMARKTYVSVPCIQKLYGQLRMFYICMGILMEWVYKNIILLLVF